MIETIASVGFLGLCSWFLYDSLEKKDNTNNICNYKELKDVSGEGIMCSKNVRLSIKKSNTHTLMIAPSESGKSRRWVMPNVNKLKNCSIVCNDPAGEIEKTCRTDKNTYVFSPFSKNSIGYDPILNCKDEFEVRKIANVILTNGINANKDKCGDQQSWVNMATPLLVAYMLMNFETEKYTFDEMIKRLCTMPILSEAKVDKDGNIISVSESIAKEIKESGVESAITEMSSFLQVKEAKQTLSSIRTVLNTCLQLFFDNNLKNIFHKPNFDLSKLRREESIIYIQIPERHSSYYSPLVATFLTQMFDILLDENGLQIYCLFDEWGTCGIIPHMADLLGTCRKFGISLNCAVQSLQQIYVLYGETEGKAIVELFKTILVCGGLRESAEYISNLLCTKDYKENDMTHTKLLMTPDEIRRLNKDKVLIICDNKRPVIDDMMDIVA